MTKIIAALRLFSLIAMTGLSVPAPVSAQEVSPAPIPLAVADFDYTDTSGETRDQKEAHAALLGDFADRLRDRLAKSGKYRIVNLQCRQLPCSAATTDPAELIVAARTAGARLLVYGGIHKMSTLVQFGKAQAVDLQADRLVFDQTVSFRGDNDEAWRRAGEFLAEQLLAASPPEP
jgi:hypothetical protein